MTFKRTREKDEKATKRQISSLVKIRVVKLIPYCITFSNKLMFFFHFISFSSFIQFIEIDKLIDTIIVFVKMMEQDKR